MKPAARISDACLPAVRPVGANADTAAHMGMVVWQGIPTVLIGNLAAAVVSDTCVSPLASETIVTGSKSVLIGGKPAARMGDTTSGGGTIASGCPNVMIGD